MLARVQAPALHSLDGSLIDVECDLAHGLPGFVIVGLGNKAVEEARERVRSAIKNSGLLLPPKRLTLNLAPADLPKDGTGYDLAIAVAVLVASNQVPAASVHASLFVGELALDGSLRPVHGSIVAAQLAVTHDIPTVYVPAANAAEAALIENVRVIPVRTLRELYNHLVGDQHLNVVATTTITTGEPAPNLVDLNDIYGQDQAKRALEVAAAGGHNLLLSGPPGSGKTLLAKALCGLFPPLDFDEMLEVTRIHSLAGMNPAGVIRTRPFRAPHHTSSSVALIGGGTIPRPGEISLSHRGVLFLDELPEFPRPVLEVLRQPLEDSTVTVARASGVTTFPADFMLVATRNPCPCGYAGDPLRTCVCPAGSVSRYQRRLSGPFLDRIDIAVEVGRVDHTELAARRSAEGSAPVAKRIAAARERQQQRFTSIPIALNSQMSNTQLREHCHLQAPARTLLVQAARRLDLSARSYNRVIKVARTIADLDAQDTITTDHISEALQYRLRL